MKFSIVANTKQENIREILKKVIGFVEDFEFRTAYDFRHKGKRIDKQVFWYIAETETMAVKISHEHQEHLWLEWQSAMMQLTHQESKGVLAAAHAHMKSIGKD